MSMRLSLASKHPHITSRTPAWQPPTDAPVSGCAGHAGTLCQLLHYVPPACLQVIQVAFIMLVQEWGNGSSQIALAQDSTASQLLGAEVEHTACIAGWGANQKVQAALVLQLQQVQCPAQQLPSAQPQPARARIAAIRAQEPRLQQELPQQREGLINQHYGQTKLQSGYGTSFLKHLEESAGLPRLQ
ncbi:hypothetical protein MMC29_004714 [Sticta canariensis]|nr:hypothetical protein [Sticta canariensis]